jgi:hypothetical protein
VNSTVQAAATGVVKTATDLTQPSTAAPTGAVGDTAPTVPVLSNVNHAVQDVGTTVTSTTGALAQGLSSTVTGLGNGLHGGTG